MMIDCFKTAKYFLASVDEEAGDSISNLKLQKLAYYAQGLHLAVTGSALFPEPIEAWTHGPVVPALYRKYKEYGANPIPREEIDPSDYTPQTLELLDEVWSVYGQFSATKLRNMTHEESPWIDAHNSGGGQISQAAMEVYFKSQLVGA